MDEIKIIALKESVLEDNDRDAQALRDELKAQGTCLLNLMSSPGSGKTTTLLALNRAFGGRLRWAVMEADIDSAVDARTMQEAGVPTVQLHTGGMCHLDADMTRQGIRALNIPDAELIVLENIGNLVCPAEFDTGAHKNVTILSVPEGDDKPLKYPLMYQVSDVVLINKIDAMDYFDFSIDKARERILALNPRALFFPISAKTGEGLDAVCDWIFSELKALRS
jgi:hydrogenase nickel incorporation protein HypB